MSTRAEKVAEAQCLRAEGLLLREIAERMDAKPKTVSNWLSDPDGSRLQARKDSYRGTCERCGSPTGGHNGRGPNAPRYCATCGPDVGGAIRRERARPHREAVEAAWASGLTCREMGERFGWSVSTSNVYISSLRARGYDLPHRRPPEEVARVAAASVGNLTKARAVHAAQREASR
jgi:transposase